MYVFAIEMDREFRAQSKGKGIQGNEGLQTCICNL